MWFVQVEGDRLDIDDVERALPPGAKFTIVTRFGGRCLSGQTLNEAASAHDARLVAQNILDLLNVAARLTDGSHRDVRPGGVFDADGHRTALGRAHGAIRFRGYAYGVMPGPDRSAPPRQRTLAELMLELDGLVPEVGEVVALLGAEATPSDLYKVFEVLRTAGCEPWAMGWVSKAEQGRFTRSVNHPDVLGAHARHARSGSSAPAKPMDAQQARSFIEERVRNWLQWLAEHHGVATQDHQD